jgi:hypothetical protein
VRSTTPIAKKSADGVVLFHGLKLLDDVENYCQQALFLFDG